MYVSPRPYSTCLLFNHNRPWRSPILRRKRRQIEKRDQWRAPLLFVVTNQRLVILVLHVDLLGKKNALSKECFDGSLPRAEVPSKALALQFPHKPLLPVRGISFRERGEEFGDTTEPLWRSG